MEKDYDNDGNNIVPCPICLNVHCPSKEDGFECPEKAAFAGAMETPKIKSVEHFVEVDGVGVAVTREGGKLWLSVSGSKEYTSEIKTDRTALHTSLVAAVEGLKVKERATGMLDSQVPVHNRAIDKALTIINSIFKE